MPSSSSARMTRTAISPRLATRTFENMGRRCYPGTAEARTARSSQCRAAAAWIRRRMPDHLVLVRHGESTWNAEHRLQGQLDPPLSETGRRQALELKPLVERIEVPRERVIASDLSRARETAALLGLEPGRTDPRWREIDIGEWGGRTAAEVEAESDELTNWRGGARTAPDGETWDEFTARVADAVDELVAAGGP